MDRTVQRNVDETKGYIGLTPDVVTNYLFINRLKTKHYVSTKRNKRRIDVNGYRGETLPTFIRGTR